METLGIVHKTWTNVYDCAMPSEPSWTFLHDYGDGTELRLYKNEARRVCFRESGNCSSGEVLEKASLPEGISYHNSFADEHRSRVVRRLKMMNGLFWISPTFEDNRTGQIYAFLKGCDSTKQEYLLRLNFEPLQFIIALELPSSPQFSQSFMTLQISRDGSWVGGICEMNLFDVSCHFWRAPLNQVERNNSLHKFCHLQSSKIQVLPLNFYGSSGRMIHIQNDGVLWFSSNSDSFDYYGIQRETESNEINSGDYVWKWDAHILWESAYPVFHLAERIIHRIDFCAVSDGRLYVSRRGTLLQFELTKNPISLSRKWNLNRLPIITARGSTNDLLDFLLLKFKPNPHLLYEDMLLSPIRWSRDRKRAWVTVHLLEDGKTLAMRKELPLFWINDSLVHQTSRFIASQKCLLDRLQSDDEILLPPELVETIQMFVN